jgi:hypothetical protein
MPYFGKPDSALLISFRKNIYLLELLFEKCSADMIRERKYEKGSEQQYKDERDQRRRDSRSDHAHIRF